MEGRGEDVEEVVTAEGVEVEGAFGDVVGDVGDGVLLAEGVVSTSRLPARLSGVLGRLLVVVEDVEDEEEEV